MSEIILNTSFRINIKRLKRKLPNTEFIGGILI